MTSDASTTIGAGNSQVRSGVKQLRVIDFDQVTLSSLNRHAVATWEDVGRPKVLVLYTRLRGTPFRLW